jgi:hypothetical protein
VKSCVSPFLPLSLAVCLIAVLAACTPPGGSPSSAEATSTPTPETPAPAATPAPVVSEEKMEERTPTASAEIPTPNFTGEVKPLLDSYCFKCHGNGKKKGGLALDAFASLEVAVQDQKTWGHVLETLRVGDMPPDDEKQPSLEEREKIMTWIDRVVFAVDPSNPDPGRVTIRRLNRAEYNNTIRDLVGVDFQPADDFPADDSGYGFDNIGDVLSLPPVLFERYLAAAEKVMSLAILNDHKPRPEKIYVDLMQIEGGPKAGTTSVARKIDENESTVMLDLPVAGEYAIKLIAESEKIGGEGAKMEWKFNGQTLRTTELTGR